MASSKCSEKPIFVVIKQTSTGYSFDNDVNYSSPFANHTISQTSDMTHPSIMVKSNWGMAKKNSITQLVTGNAGFKILENRKNSNFYKSYSTGEAVGLLLNDTHGYRLGRYKGLSGEAPSVAELANLLGSISRSSKDVKVRGSPLEYKRLLDYFQFLLTRKVSGDANLFLTRPNNVNVLDDMNDTIDVSLEDVYMGLFDGDLSNRTMYNKAYFVTADRPAAIASVVRQVPTIFQEAASKKSSMSKFHLIPPGNNGRILRYLTQELTRSGFTISSNGIVSIGDLKIIDKTKEIEWYLDTTLLFNKRVVSKVELRALVLFYWIFNYPSRTSNIPIVEAFFSIVDTFHDFKPTSRTNGKGNTEAIGSLMGQKQNRENFKARKANTINLTNVSNTRVAHKTLVRLLGSDIYRKVKSGYGKALKNTLSNVNKRQITPDEKVGRFLYFVTNVFGSDSGGLINACEDLSRDTLINISGNNPIYTRTSGNSNTNSNALCVKLESEGACLIIDYMIGSLPDCLIKHSVFHNVGVLDPASKRILSWSEVEGGDGCIETPKDQKKRKQKKAEARKRASKLKDSKAKQKAGERRKVKSQATRIETVKKMANKARQNQINIARRRQIATARREGGRTVRNTQPAPTPFTRTNTPSNMKMTIGKVSPKKPTTAKKPPLQPTLKRSRNNNQNNNKTPAKKPPLPPRSGVRVSRGPGNAPATGTRSARSVQRTRNAPPASGTRSASARRTPVAPTSATRRTPGTRPATAGRPPVARTPTTATRRTPGSAQV